MNIGNSFFITNLKVKIEKKLEVYNPNLLTHLSKQLYDEYLIKSKIYNEVLEVLETNDITREKIEGFLHKKINLTNELNKNSKYEEDIKKNILIIEEYENLIKLTRDPLGYK
ncbi:MAG: hypothetical protein ACTSPA_10470 [Promethearchaeota archaeon]